MQLFGPAPRGGSTTIITGVITLAHDQVSVSSANSDARLSGDCYQAISTEMAAVATTGLPLKVHKRQSWEADKHKFMNRLLNELRHNPILWLLVFVTSRVRSRKAQARCPYGRLSPARLSLTHC